MFKKRKPNDPAPEAGLAPGLEGVGPDAVPSGASQSQPLTASGPMLRQPARPADNGLGVPPYRPATPPKEPPAMGRLPSQPPAPPAPSAPPPGAPGVRPAGSRPGREPAERRTLVVGRGISVQGTVQDAERLVVEGTVEASMITATELAIAPGGVFKGEVEVEDAEIAGTIDGTLTVRNNMVLRATGKLLGKARYRRLQVEDGGQISGQVEMIAGDTPRPDRAERAPAAAEE